MRKYRLFLWCLLVLNILCICYVFHKNEEDSTLLVQAGKQEYVQVGGYPVGIYMETTGVMVVDNGTVNDVKRGQISPAEHVLRSGDYILKINGEQVACREDLNRALTSLASPEVQVDLMRNGESMQVKLTCADTKNGYKLGVWVRDDMQGIGTMTYVRDREFAALGHSITDQDTGRMVMGHGRLLQATIIDIKKGEAGSPGELAGMISYGTGYEIGKIKKNTEHGIYGTLLPGIVLMGEKLPAANRKEIRKGTAYIHSFISGEPKDYEIQITALHLGRADETKGLEFKVVDEELLSLTGGIVQGMSGSPIVQDGKLIGAVTHVFVNDPTRGYGIFIDVMME